MENFDVRAESAVWRRVMAPAQSGGDIASPLLAPAAEALADYRALAGTLTGRNRERAQDLLTSQRETLAALSGLVRLADGTAELRPLPSGNGSAAARLVRSFHRSRWAAGEYTLRTADPRFGAVFRVLAAREETSAALLAAMLGTL